MALRGATVTTAAVKPWSETLLGQEINEFRLLSILGQGGFGIVFEALDSLRDRRVALKVLIPNDDDDATLEFGREGELLQRLSDASNVLNILDSGTFNLRVQIGIGGIVALPIRYHVCELADGCLEALLAHRDSLNWVERLQLWRGVILGVHQMHLKQVVHRDLKSENCLLFALPKNRVDCKVSDLGRARYLGAPAQHSFQEYLTGRGDLRFAPPEFLWLQGENSSRTHRAADLYGLGSILFEVATGQGITAISLGYGPEVLSQALKLGARNSTIDLSGLRGKYEPAFQLFASNLPKAISKSGLELVRQLCDPVPEARFPRSRRTENSHHRSLEWLLRRADILIKTQLIASSGRTKRQAQTKRGA